MTENKRFKLKTWYFADYRGIIHDYQENKELQLNAYGVVDLINALHEENQDLRTGTYINAKNTIKELHEENRELFQIIQNQSTIIQELHTKLMGCQLGEDPVITLTKKDLNQMGKAISYYTHQKAE